MKAVVFPRFLACLAALGVADLARASILTEFNNATLVADFQFDDALGTPIESTANSVDPLALWDTDADFGGAATNGAGQFDAVGKNNTELGTVYVDTPSISSGVVYALFDVSWSFDESIYVGAQDEEFRLSLIQFDPRSTFVTAETFFTRTSATEVELYGNAVGTGATDTPDLVLGSSGDLLTILRADLGSSTFELFYSADDGLTFSSAGSGVLDPTRGIESIRFVLNEDFSNDGLTVDRIAFAYVPEPMATTLALLGVAVFASASRRTAGR